MIEKIKFGNTGHLSTRCIFGGTALSSVDQDTADQTLELLIKYDKYGTLLDEKNKFF